MAFPPDGVANRLRELTFPAIIVSVDGVVLGSNQVHTGLFEGAGTEVAGRSLRELIGGRFAEEVLDVARRVVGDGVPRNTVAMWRGHWTRVRYTRLECAGAVACVIGVNPWRHPLFEAGPPGEAPPRVLSVHDLGDLATLSAREVEVLWMIGHAKSLPQIAKALVRSNKTIESHVRTISVKVKARGRLALGLFAHERGITHMTLEQVNVVFSERPSSRATADLD